MPDVPAVSGTHDLIARVREIFELHGPLAAVLPDYEPRVAQRAMAEAVAQVLAEPATLLAEAGTGTGKTLAYLVPAILSGRRVLVSTGTKNLQDQIYFKDLPLLRRALGVSFSATYMKGRANYLCLHRFDQLRDSLAALPPSDRVHLTLIDEWAAGTMTGDRAEIDELPEDLPLWNDVSATAESCLGNECPQFQECFVTRMRQAAAAADVVIVNHHLLCADAAVRQHSFGEVIPDCHVAVIDEAHQLEDVATQYFGVVVSTYRIDDLARDGLRVATELSASDTTRAMRLHDALSDLTDQSTRFFAELRWKRQGTSHQLPAATGPGPHSNRRGPERFGADSADGRITYGGATQVRAGAGLFDERVRLTSDSLTKVQESGAALVEALDGVAATSTDKDESEDLQNLARRARELRDELRFLLGIDDPSYVYFLETRGRGVFLRASPIDVSAIVREHLIGRWQTSVLTSATLAVGGRFDYMRGRLGVSDALEVQLPSEFDYSRQAVLYLPPSMPDPRSPHFGREASREVAALLERTEGRAFVLFTSYATLREVRSHLADTLPYPLFVQGSAPRTVLLDQFRTTANAVLLATSSFWQGVDVIGDALSCVIIDKLPFASPGDPITAARIEAIQNRGGDAFSEYQVPLAILTLLQGLGRLIRHRLDRGVLAILDPRLRTKGYGRYFLSSLPRAPIVQDLDEVSRFLRDC